MMHQSMVTRKKNAAKLMKVKLKFNYKLKDLK